MQDVPLEETENSNLFDKNQTQIQHFKEVSQTAWVQTPFLTAVWTSRYTFVIICITSSNLIGWLGVHQCKTPTQWKDSIPWILTYSQFWKTSINLQPAKQGLFSPILEAAVQMNFAVNLARFLEHLLCITYIIIYKIGVLENLAKLSGKHLYWSLFLIKL